MSKQDPPVVKIVILSLLAFMLGADGLTAYGESETVLQQIVGVLSMLGGVICLGHAMLIHESWRSRSERSQELKELTGKLNDLNDSVMMLKSSRD